FLFRTNKMSDSLGMLPITPPRMMQMTLSAARSQRRCREMRMGGPGPGGGRFVSWKPMLALVIVTASGWSSGPIWDYIIWHARSFIWLQMPAQEQGCNENWVSPRARLNNLHKNP